MTGHSIVVVRLLWEQVVSVRFRVPRQGFVNIKHMERQSWIFRWKRQSAGKSVLGFFGLIFLAAFPAGFLFIGWTTVSVRCERSSVGVDPDCAIAETHWFGLYADRRNAEGVLSVETETGSIHSRSLTGAGYNRNVVVEGVILSTKRGDVALISGKSNVNDDEKEHAKTVIGAYLDDADQQSFAVDMDFRNVFGYVGLVGLAFVAWMTWKMVWGAIFPQRIDLDRIRGSVSVRSKTGQMKTREFLVQDIADATIVSGATAFAFAFPRLAKFGGGSSKSSSVSDSIVFRLVSGEEIGIPNFAEAPQEELEEIVGSIRAAKDGRLS